MIDYLPDGQLTISCADGTKATLRQPTLGEFRRWRGDWQGQVDHLTTVLRDLADKSKKKGADIDALKAERNTVDDETMTTLLEWWADVISTLSDDVWPSDVDVWPVELAYGEEIIPTVLNHWRGVPSAPGVS